MIITLAKIRLLARAFCDHEGRWLRGGFDITYSGVVWACSGDVGVVRSRDSMLAGFFEASKKLVSGLFNALMVRIGFSSQVKRKMGGRARCNFLPHSLLWCDGMLMYIHLTHIQTAD